MELGQDVGELMEGRGGIDEENVALEPGHGELAVASENNAALGGGLGQEGLSFWTGKVCGQDVVAEDAKPARQSLQHGVGQERGVKGDGGGGRSPGRGS
jgi:hypothetical protein